MTNNIYIKDQLHKSRLELLDISFRNRLLNVPRLSKHAKIIEAIEANVTEIYRLLITERKAISFLPGNDSNNEKVNEDSQNHSQLHTLLTSEKLQKRLLTLYYDAQTFREEQGVNILYLALGLLRWYESPTSDVERYAPLLLIPVDLQRKNIAEKFLLRWDQEDISGNLSLQAKLSSEFGINFPLPDNEEEFDISAYFTNLTSSLTSHTRWEILPNEVVLGFFSFAKFLMYRDLDPANWPNEQSLDTHPLITALLQDGFIVTDNNINDNIQLDEHISPAQSLHVLDADSSQTLAIHQALSGHSMVIQGPPGTGKSQTITNIITAAVAKGEKVLFVAEKMAALEVVKRRLENIDLGSLCLELHSHKMTKTAVLADLKRTSEIGCPTIKENKQLHQQLSELRETLNRHSTRINTRLTPCELTPFEIIGHLVKLQQNGQTTSNHTLIAAQTWTPQNLQERETLLTNIIEIIRNDGLPCLHPWRGVRIKSILRTDVERLLLQFADISAKIATLQHNLEQLSQLTEQPIAKTFSAVGRNINISNWLVSSPRVESEAFTVKGWRKHYQELTDLINAGKEQLIATTNLRGKVNDRAWNTNVEDARRVLVIHKDSWLRFFNLEYWRAIKLLASLLTIPMPKTLYYRVRILDLIMMGQNATQELAEKEDFAKQVLGNLWQGTQTNWTALSSVQEWLDDLIYEKINTKLRFVAAKLNKHKELEQLLETIEADVSILKKQILSIFYSLGLNIKESFGKADLDNVPFEKLMKRFTIYQTKADDLHRWINLQTLMDEANSKGLSNFIAVLYTGNLNIDKAITEFHFVYFETLLQKFIQNESELATFQGDLHNQKIQLFRKLDRESINFNRIQIANIHYVGLPKTETAIGPLGILKGEFVRKRGHLPIRKLIRAAAPAIQALKPVFMMSPLSVAQFLEPGAISFDLLLIDEASQVMPIDAMGAIARCRRMVVVGDDRQLPPTRFFTKIVDETEDAEDENLLASASDMESILGLCVAKGLQQNMLRWHYRSRHHSLIAISNKYFYDNRLFIVPSPQFAALEMGLKFHHLPDSIYDSGGTATNPIEARAVAAAVVTHARTFPNLSLGVGTFSIKQRQAILDELESLRSEYPDIEGFFQSDRAEPFFVKNLENIQGDERDVIMISVGYGRNKDGAVAMRFGPLNTVGGERRLNVLISRAKIRCEIFSSITDENIDLERTRSQGVAVFKAFLHFARTGQLDSNQITTHEFNSIFEEQVAVALRQHGYEVHSQIGIAGCFIDLAVIDPQQSNRYLLGIECDGVNYHSANSARDRDRLRQEILENQGWILHKIWSMDWFQRPQEQLHRTLKAIEAAKQVLETRDAETALSRIALPEPISIERQLPDIKTASAVILSVPYIQAVVTIPQQPLHEVSAKTMANIIREIVAIEAPIHSSEIMRRVRSLWGLSRTNSRIEVAMKKGLTLAANKNNWQMADEFWIVPDMKISIRDRSNVESAALRKPEMLPPQEIRVAISRLIETNYGATREQLITGVARLFGFKSTRTQLKAVIETQIDYLIKIGTVKEVGSNLTL